MVKLDYNIPYRKGKIYTDDSTLSLIRNHFSEKVAGINFIRKACDNKFIPDRNYAVQKTGTFDFGLYQEIENFLISEQITDVEFTEEFQKRKQCGYGIEDVFDGLAYGNRYYGLETVKTALSVGYGTVVIGTGGGKSMVIASLVENIWRNSNKPFKCLIIVPGLSLVSQLCSNFEEYGVSFGYSGWTGKTPLQDTEVIICNSENFCARFNSQEWLRTVDLVITDEAHKNKKENIISKNIAKIKTPHKFGFTGTLPESKIDRWKILGTFGPVIYEKSSKELRDENYLSDVIVQVLKLNYGLYLEEPYKNELKYLYTSKVRNDLIKNIVGKLNKNTLILVNNISHGELLSEILQIPGKETHFVRGSMEVLDRISIIDQMEKRDNIICIAMSSIFSTGINITNLHYILFVSGGKSFVRTIQSVGRGLRLHDTKNRLTLFDLYDNMKYSSGHGTERKRFYEKEKIRWKETEIVL